MSVVQGNRAGLDQALEDDRLTVILLSGSPSGAAGKIYDRITQVIEQPFRKAFLIISLDVLSPAERSKWFGGDVERFAVIGGKGRVVAVQGSTSELMLSNGTYPSTLAIRRVFARGDGA